MYLRVWQKLNLKDVEKSLLVVGDLSAECFNCHKLGIDKKSHTCPGCGVVFKYVGFRKKSSIQVLRAFKEDMPQVKLIDFFDFKRALNKKEAHSIFKDK